MNTTGHAWGNAQQQQAEPPDYNPDSQPILLPLAMPLWLRAAHEDGHHLHHNRYPLVIMKGTGQGVGLSACTSGPCWPLAAKIIIKIASSIQMLLTQYST